MKMVAFKPIDLRVDFASGDMPVTNSHNPVFSWAALHNGKNQKQKGYHITAYRENVVIWDSGYVEDDKQQAIYAGNPLENNDIIKWCLVLTDIDGNMSESAESDFIVSYGECFDTNWITSSNYRQRDVNCFEKNFVVSKEVKRAVFSVCGLGIHEAYFNGKRIDESYFQPVFSDYDKVMYYCVSLLEGEVFQKKNEIKIHLADGWRNNKGPWSEQMLKNHPVPLFGDQILGAKLNIYYVDGSHEVIKTDESWTVTKTATRSHLFEGEEYDENFNLEIEKAVVGTKPNGRLMTQCCQAEKMQERYKPVSVVPCDDGGFLVDFGVNIAGFCEIKIPVSIQDGRTIILRHSERIDDDYELYTESLRSAVSVDKYITKEGGREAVIWHPHFTYHGFRYVHISGLDFVEDDTITAIAVYSDVVKHSSFTCSDSVINQIQNAIIQTEKDNIHGLFTDCPQRDERMGWMNDSTVRFEQIPYNFDTAKLYTKVIADCVAVQDDIGRISCTAPYFFGCIPADPVCSAFMVAAYENLIHYGDLYTVKKYYKNFKMWNEFLKTQSKDWIVEYSHYGDWAGPAKACVSMEDPHSAVTPAELMSTGYFYYNYKLLEKFSQALGYEKRKEYRECAEYVKQAMLDKWVDEDGTVASGSQGAQAFALWLNILPSELEKKVAETLNNRVVENDYKSTCGNLTMKRLLEMLCKYGYENTAFEVISRSEYPSLGYMLKRGATTIWERFEDKKNSQMNSHNHPMYGALGSWFYEYLAGITPIEPAFAKVRIKPYFPEKLEYVKAVADTIKGKILVEWKRSEGKIYLYVSIPFGVSAEICADGIHRVGSGFYKFVIGE